MNKVKVKATHFLNHGITNRDKVTLNWCLREY